ncbi:neprilysin-11-like [Dermacentor variabilis]|uniref:neprilysin-11-like n=1 Tax=Dermacentor variabilis TaxID=34621 RepID=UPI003F5BD284
MSSRLPIQLALSCVYCALRMSFIWLTDRLFPWCDHPSHCFDFSAELAASVNRRVDPCDNFYDHVCGFWNGSHGGTRDQFELLASRTRLLLFQELEKSPSSFSFTSGSRVTAGYQRCLAVMAEKQEHTAALHELLAEFHLEWPSLEPPRKEFDFLSFLVGLGLRYNIHLLVKFTLVPYLLTDEGYSLMVADVDSQSWRTTTTDMHSDCLRAFTTRIDRLRDVAERMARVRAELFTLDIISRANHPYSPRYYQFRQLPTLTRGRISDSAWLEVFNSYLKPDVQVGPEDLLLASSESPFFFLWRTLTRFENTMVDVLLVLGWKVVMDEAYAFSATLSGCSKKENFRDSLLVSADICVIAMLQLAPAALGHVLLGAVGSMDMVKRSAALTEHIRNASVRSFQTLGWMDANTSRANMVRTDGDNQKLVAQDRMMSIVSVDAVPAHLLDTAAVDKNYDFLPSFSEDAGTFGWQLLEARKRRFEKLRRLMYTDPEKIKRRSELSLPILSVNAFYMPIFHVIYVTGAIMQSPFAVRADEPAINYGSLGRIIGHELSHAFYVSTTSVDEHLQPFRLYSPSSYKEFLGRLACLAKQVNDGSGSQTLGNNSISETFADNAGIQKAYLAFKALLQSDPLLNDKPANPLGYTAQQLFFVSGCFVFCAFQGYASDQNAVYPPPFLRCNMPAMNTRDFGVAFSCAQGAPMNPIIRCNFH